MIGIIPGNIKTFIVEGYLDDKLEEDKLYADKKDNRIYLYSTKENRSSPATGYFPIWDGKKKFITQFSNEKYLDKDVVIADINGLSNNINSSIADKVKLQLRKAGDEDLLRPLISDEDNMFTQCIKGVLNQKEYTISDLIEISRLSEKLVTNYYIGLNKISFMRLEKWNIWVSTLLRIKYNLIIYKEDKKLLTYTYPDEKFDTGIIKYDSIINGKDDSFKKIIKIIMVMENINKDNLKNEEIDEYTVNNMLTTLKSNKPFSAQLFSRFIKLADLSYEINMIDKEKLLFQYQENM